MVLTLFLQNDILCIRYLLTYKLEGSLLMKVAYIRVSSVDQCEDRQLEGLAKFNIEKTFTEKVSGKNMDRPKLKELLNFVREGDTVYVHDFSRLARSTKDLLSIVEYLNNKKVNLVSNKENVDSSTPQGKLMLTMIGAIYEFERANLLERQREGIEIKKNRDKMLPPEKRTYKGRKVVSVPDFDKHYQRYINREVSKVQLAKELDISRPTLDKLISNHIMNRTNEPH